MFKHERQNIKELTRRFKTWAKVNEVFVAFAEVILVVVILTITCKHFIPIDTPFYSVTKK